MKRFSDESGWVRVIMCFAALLVHHGLRDAIITALPTLAFTNSTPSFTSSTPTPAFIYIIPTTQENEAVTDTSVESAYTTTSRSNLTLSTMHFTNISFTNGKEIEETSLEENNMIAAHTSSPPGSVMSLIQSGTDDEAARLDSSLTTTPTVVDFFESNEKGNSQSGIMTLPLSILSFKHETETTNDNQDNYAPKINSRSKSVDTILSRFFLFEFRSGKDTNSPYKSVNDGTQNIFKRSVHNSRRTHHIHRTRYKTMQEERSAIDNLKYDIPKYVKLRGSEILVTSSSWPRHSSLRTNRRRSDHRQEEIHVEERKVYSISAEGYKFKEEWSLVVEGATVSSVFWGWFFSALLADLLIDRAGAPVVLSISLGGSGLLGLLTHAATLGGPWPLLGLRVVQGTIQGVGYPAVMRVMEDIPSAVRPAAALLVFLGPSLGTGLGTGLGSLHQWYISTYVMGSLALVLTPLCLMLPPPPTHAAPHKEMYLKSVLKCRCVWACVGVHVANTWMLHTLLVGLLLCLTHTNLHHPSASGWVSAALVVAMFSVVRILLFLAAKLTGKRPSTVLHRRRIPVVAGSVMVTAAAIVMATAGLNSVEVLVGVGVCLAGLGVGIARVGYRLNVDDMAPLGPWRVTKVLDAAAVVTAALSPLITSALAQGGAGGWVAVWVVPGVAVVPAAGIFCFLLTSNPQSWDHTNKPTGAATNGAAGGDASVNGVAATLSVGRQSFKSARSALTFKTARSRSRTRTISCRTIDDDLEVDMYSVAESSVACRSVVDDPDQECVSVASSSTFKSDGADMHSVAEADGITTAAAATAAGKGGRQFGSMLVNGGTTDRTSAWLSSHHDIVLEAGGDTASPSRPETHASNAIYGLLW